MRTTSWMWAAWAIAVSCLMGAAPKSIFDFDNEPMPTTRSSPPQTQPVTPPDPTPTSKPPVDSPPIVRPVPPVDVVPPAPAAKLPRPDDQRCALLLRKVRMIYEKEYARTDAPGKKELARTMLAEAGLIQKNFDARYVLLDESLDLSAGVADVVTCRQAIEQLDRGYTVEASALAYEALLKLLPRAGSDEGVIEWGLRTLDQLLAREEYASATKLSQALGGPVAQGKNAAAQAQYKRCQTHLSEYVRVVPSLGRLKNAPDDPAANSAAGRFYCFVRGDWDKGLPMLSKGSDAAFKALATRDLGAPADARGQLDLGHLWWDASKDNAAIQSSVRARAGFWYAKALPSLTDDLDRVLVKKRLAESKAHAGPPMLTNSIGIRLVRIEAGEFVMGSPIMEADRVKDETQFKVAITKPFYMGAHEITQEQYQAVVGSTSGVLKGDKHLPVEMVNWEDAVRFCEKLSQKEGKSYRLPTEAEWEYACRAGTTGSFSGKGRLDDIAWYLANSDKRIHPVGQKQSNGWGLYDVHGNVWEWCSDWYGTYPSGTITDPKGSDIGKEKVLRGGSRDNLALGCRSAIRNHAPPEKRFIGVGFRVVFDLYASGQ